jgi:hypothetical protein
MVQERVSVMSKCIPSLNKPQLQTVLDEIESFAGFTATVPGVNVGGGIHAPSGDTERVALLYEQADNPGHYVIQLDGLEELYEAYWQEAYDAVQAATATPEQAWVVANLPASAADLESCE